MSKRGIFTNILLMLVIIVIILIMHVELTKIYRKFDQIDNELKNTINNYTDDIKGKCDENIEEMHKMFLLNKQPLLENENTNTNIFKTNTSSLYMSDDTTPELSYDILDDTTQIDDILTIQNISESNKDDDSSEFNKDDKFCESSDVSDEPSDKQIEEKIDSIIQENTSPKLKNITDYTMAQLKQIAKERGMEMTFIDESGKRKNYTKPELYKALNKN